MQAKAPCGNIHVRIAIGTHWHSSSEVEVWSETLLRTQLPTKTYLLSFESYVSLVSLSSLQLVCAIILVQLVTVLVRSSNISSIKLQMSARNFNGETASKAQTASGRYQSANERAKQVGLSRIHNYLAMLLNIDKLSQENSGCFLWNTVALASKNEVFFFLTTPQRLSYHALYCAHHADDPCQLEKDSGPCVHNRPQPRYYFDKKSLTCKRFDYLGCHGNKNNFLTEEACTERCQGQCKTFIRLFMIFSCKTFFVFCDPAFIFIFSSSPVPSSLVYSPNRACAVSPLAQVRRQSLPV